MTTRTSIRMLQTEDSNFDTARPTLAHLPSWNTGNVHHIEMQKRRPRSPPKPKDPTPTVKELFSKPVGGSLRVFNPSAHEEIVRGALEADRAKARAAKKGNILGPSNETSFASNTESEMREEDVSLRPESPSRRRKEILEMCLQHRKEDDERRMEGLRKVVLRNQKRKDDDFSMAYTKLKEEEATFVTAVDKYLKNKDGAAQQRRRGLHSEWTECVFNKIQDQLLDRIDNMKEQDIQGKRRELFQNYIDASARKGGGLFLDIVIENEYDPFGWKKDTLRYRAKPAKLSNGPGFTDRFGNPVFDPVKRDLEKLKAEARAATTVGGGGSVLEGDGSRVGRETLGHEHWSKMEATPFYDRAAKVQDAIAAGRTPPVRKGTKTTIEVDEFAFPKGPQQVTKEIHGLYGRGKRTFKDWQPGGKSPTQAQGQNSADALPSE